MTYKVYPFPDVKPDGSLVTFQRCARSQLPFIEGPDNHNPYAPLVGHEDHHAWCMSFLCAVAKKSGVMLPANTASTLAMANAFRKVGRWGSTPKVGAFGFIFIPSLGRIGHVFEVEAVREDGFHVVSIEGNTDEKGGRTGGRVMRHVRGSVVGYGYPVYTSITVPIARVDQTLKKGMGPSQSILNVQNYMRKLGNTKFKPGYFDQYMEDVVKRYQKNRGMKVTGIVDEPVWIRIRQGR